MSYIDTNDLSTDFGRIDHGSSTDFERIEIEGSIPNRFRKIAQNLSSKTAIVTDDETISYEELDRRSSKVANAILSAKPARENPIPLIFGHDQRAIVALLGVLKAGYSYTLLDPKSPSERTLRIVDDLDADILIHSAETKAEALNISSSGLRLFDLDRMVAENETADHRPAIDIAPNDLAYVVYTSGSTGAPKGVMQTHRNVLHRAYSYATTARLTSEDRLVLFYSPSASGAVRDIFGSILTGCSLHLYDLRERGFEGLTEWLRSERITVYNSVATVFRHLARTLSTKHDLPDLRLVQLGSETIYRSDAESYKALLPDTCTFVARLGSSEISPICKYTVDKHTAIDFSTVPAGYPVDDVRVDIIDEQGVALPPGVTGEIVVTSRYLTPGYWRQPEVNAALFTPSPEEAGARRFKTGDLGVITDAGFLVHMGRKDFQVKIRGFRVEPAEIESHLMDLECIRESVILADANRNGDTRLIAYVVAEAGKDVTGKELGELLKDRLPAYMIPSYFKFLEVLPTNATGKVDRLALSRISIGDLNEDNVEPANPMEEELERIFASVLGVDRVSTTDSFLDLGGSSLTAMQIASSIKKRFHVSIPLEWVFDQPSVKELAERVGLMAWLADSQESAPDSDGDYETGSL